MTPKEIIDFIKAKNIEILDLKFQDFPGTWQHFNTGEPGRAKSSTRGWASMDPASVAGRRSMPAT